MKQINPEPASSTRIDAGSDAGAVLRHWNARAAIARHYYATRTAAQAPGVERHLKVTRHDH